MGDVAVAALAGYGCALILGWGAPRLEKWWQPTWRATRWAFNAARTTPAATAAAGSVASLTSSPNPVRATAAGAFGWLIAQAYVLLIVTARR